MTDLTGKIALITGSARGIGKAIAERYGSRGASIVVNYSSDRERANAAVDCIERLGGTAIAIQADVSKVADIERLFAATVEHFGRLDIVVANAGVELIDRPVVEVSEADFDRLFAVNTKGAFFTLQNAARHVADNGRIIYVGSAYPLPGYGLYGRS
jgi:3-oxoacyl-[acyl-carrier protein] reductase